LKRFVAAARRRTVAPSPAAPIAHPPARARERHKAAENERELAVTANTYSHVLVDESELDYGEVLAV
jgi:hypothetical protein